MQISKSVTILTLAMSVTTSTLNWVAITTRMIVIVQTLSLVISMIERDDPLRITYKIPRANTTVRAVFLCWDICRCHTIGIGRIMMVKSITTLMMPSTRKDVLLDPQVPGRRGSQILAKGRQIRKAWRMRPIPNERTKAITVYTA